MMNIKIKDEEGRMLDVTEVVVKGERFYKIVTLPLDDKSAVHSLFTTVEPGNFGNTENIKTWKIEEPYYDFEEE
jgi:hypothetical protein